jgi:hypothetical protein
MDSNRQLINKAATSGTMNNFGDRFVPGTHVLALDNLAMKKLWNDDIQATITCVTADFFVLASDTLKPGQKVSEKYDIGKPGTGGENAGKRLNGLARAVTESLGITQKPEDATGAGFNAKVEKNLWDMLEIDDGTGLTRTAGRRFLGRGITIRCFSKNNTARKGKHAGKEFCNQDFSAVAQTKDDIKAKRAIIEAPPEPKPSASDQAAEALKSAGAGKVETRVAPKPEPAAPDDDGDDMLAGLE